MGTLETVGSQLRDRLPEGKQTSLGLYVTSAEAYEMWRRDPEHVHVLDVRTPEEYIFVGHPEMARNVPLVFVKYQWNCARDEPEIEPDVEFVARVKGLYSPADTLMMMCRSGGRSAKAVGALAQAGFKRVFNIIDGFEGDKVDDPSSYYHGKRMKNGWKNSGAPWTYDCDPDLLWIVND
jgi:rhodanese-related sulfurtransferase